MKYTIAEVNHALQSGCYLGTFDTIADAQNHAKLQAARCQTFMEYRIHEGTSKDPGRQVGLSIRRGGES